MKLTRRDFMQRLAVFSAAGFAPRFITNASAEEVRAIDGFKDDRVLVVVQLGGGNDGLNTVVPFTNDLYHNARPQLRLGKDDLLPITDDLALNGQLKGMQRLYGDGKVAVMQNVGYPNPDRSHFRSMEIWHTASDSDTYYGDGWIGRYFDNNCSGTAKPQAGMAVGNNRPQAFEGSKGFGVATDHPEKFGWDEGNHGDTEDVFLNLNGDHATQNGTLDFLRHTTTQAVASSERVRMAAEHGGVEGQIVRGNRSIDQLQAVAGLIRGGLETRIYYVSMGGFDTHANQANAHPNLLRNVDEGLAAFQEQLERDGTAGRVTTLVFSEFGRRVKENGSGGTDHGTAAPMFLLGNHVKGGVHGSLPDLANLDKGDLRYSIDFRSVYASVLENWFETDSSPVLKGTFDTLDIIA